MKNLIIYALITISLMGCTSFDNNMYYPYSVLEKSIQTPKTSYENREIALNKFEQIIKNDIFSITKTRLTYLLNEKKFIQVENDVSGRLMYFDDDIINLKLAILIVPNESAKYDILFTLKHKVNFNLYDSEIKILNTMAKDIENVIRKYYGEPRTSQMYYYNFTDSNSSIDLNRVRERILDEEYYSLWEGDDKPGIFLTVNSQEFAVTFFQ